MEEPSNLNSETNSSNKRMRNIVIIIIIVVIVFQLIYCAFGITTFYLGKRLGEKDSKEAEDCEITDTEDEDDTETTTTTTTVADPKTLVYTNPDYPDLEITYDENWILMVTEEDTEVEGAKFTTVRFSKGGYDIEYSFLPLIGFGGVPTCYKNGELEFVHIKDNWARIKSETGNSYIYDYSTIIKGVDSGSETFEDIFESWSGMTGEQDIDDYEICNFDAPIGTSTTFTIPEGDPIEGGNYIAGVSVNVSFTGTEDPDTMKEADEIVLGSEFD